MKRTFLGRAALGVIATASVMGGAGAHAATGTAVQPSPYAYISSGSVASSARPISDGSAGSATASVPSAPAVSFSATDVSTLSAAQGELGSNYGFIIPVEGDVSQDYGFIIPVAGDVSTDYGFIIPVAGEAAPEYGFIIPVAGDAAPEYGFIIPVEGDLAADYGFIIPVGGDLQDQYGFIIPVEGGIDGQYGFIIPVGGDVTTDYGFIIPVQGEVGQDYGFIIPVDGPLQGEYGFIIPVQGDVQADYGFIIPVSGDVEGNYGFIIPVAGDAAPDYGFIIPVDGDLSDAYGFIIPVGGGDVVGTYGDVMSLAGDATPDYGFIIPTEGDVSGAYGFIIPVEGEVAGQYGFIIPVEGGGITGSYGFIIPVEGEADPEYGFIIPVTGEIVPEYGFIIPVVGDVDPDYGFIIPVGGTEVVADYGFIIPVAGVQDRYGFIIPVSGGSGEVASYGSLMPSLDEVMPDYGFIIPVEGESSAGQHFGYVIPDYGFIIPVDGEYQVVPEGDVDADYGFIIPVEGEVAPYYGFIIPVDGMEDVFPSAQPVAGPNLIDHWMVGSRYSPVVSAAAGAGEGVTVGILDFSVAGNADVFDAVTWTGGISDHFAAHGTGVASLIAGGRFGFGISGIAQRADLAVFNPYDATESTNFVDSGQGIEALVRQGASVVNMSLGVEGYVISPEWGEVFSDRGFKRLTEDTVIVKAAGNDGAVQEEDVSWYGNYNNLLLVGSVGADGEISDFSNRPGSACFTGLRGRCYADGELKNRFLVAPGEQIVVADGEGGMLLASGTSLAAPLVTGAVALLHSRWPWLQHHPEASTDIILESARDLGEAGVDEVYGHGLLDIAASQRPLSASNLSASPFAGTVTFLEVLFSGSNVASRVRSWQPLDGTRTVFERVGDTYRDFTMPLSLNLLSQVSEARGTKAAFRNSFIDWRSRGFAPRLAAEAPAGVFGFGSYGVTSELPRSGLRISYSMAPTRSYLRSESGANVDAAFTLAAAGGTLSFTAGSGEGALALAGSDTLGAPQDFDLLTGGVNPVLGLASGDAFLGSAIDAGAGLRFSFGLLSRDFRAGEHTELGSQLRADFADLGDYRADAVTVGADYEVSPALSFSADLTYLKEANALLGMQSLGENALGAGAATLATTVGGRFDLGAFALEASATSARTKGGSGDVLQLGGGSLVSTAYQVALTRTGLLSETDRVRLSVAQPLHVESGNINYRGYTIVDRTTGEIGAVDQRIAIDGGNRTHIVEALYGARFLGGGAELNVFSRGEFGLDPRQAGGERAFTFGASVDLPF